MEVYTYSEARQQVARLLEQAAASPLDVPSINVKVTTRELVDMIREGRERS